MFENTLHVLCMILLGNCFETNKAGIYIAFNILLPLSCGSQKAKWDACSKENSFERSCYTDSQSLFHNILTVCGRLYDNMTSYFLSKSKKHIIKDPETVATQQYNLYEHFSNYVNKQR